jgi:hypothetical protein
VREKRREGGRKGGRKERRKEGKREEKKGREKERKKKKRKGGNKYVVTTVTIRGSSVELRLELLGLHSLLDLKNLNIGSYKHKRTSEIQFSLQFKKTSASF